jgi:hypothetical protein
VRGGRSDSVIAVQVILLHEADELRAIVRIRCVYAREGGRERIRILADSHSLAVVPTGGQELAVIIDTLGGIMVHAK